MLNDYQNIDALVGAVKGTTGLLSRLLSRKSGLALLIIVCGVIVSKLIFNYPILSTRKYSGDVAQH